MWIDSHCHLNHERNEGAAPEDLVSDARKHGVDAMVNISCQITGDFKDVLTTAKAHKNVWCTIGTHPHDAGNEQEQAISEDELVERALSDPNIIGIGESGLDYYYDNAPREAQQESFRKHIRACIQTGLPLVIHAREADKDIIRILKEEGAGPDTSLKGVMHCFSSGAQMAQEALEIGFYISFSGILTFKKADALREIAAATPVDRLLVETDSPYLAPVPFRGKTNRPAYVRYTGEVLAKLHNMSSENMAQQTTENFFQLFDKAKATQP